MAATGTMKVWVVQLIMAHLGYEGITNPQLERLCVSASGDERVVGQP